MGQKNYWFSGKPTENPKMFRDKILWNSSSDYRTLRPRRRKTSMETANLISEKPTAFCGNEKSRSTKAKYPAGDPSSRISTEKWSPEAWIYRDMYAWNKGWNENAIQECWKFGKANQTECFFGGGRDRRAMSHLENQTADFTRLPSHYSPHHIRLASANSLHRKIARRWPQNTTEGGSKGASGRSPAATSSSSSRLRKREKRWRTVHSRRPDCCGPRRPPSACGPDQSEAGIRKGNKPRRVSYRVLSW